MKPLKLQKSWGDPMEGYQRIQEKLDIKILILFILRRLPDVVDPETLASLAISRSEERRVGKEC